MGICSPSNKPCRVSRCFGIALLVIAGIAALGWIVMLLWNWLIPSLFVGANAIGYCQALGLLLLCKILFGCFRCCACRRDRRDRFENMSEEDRASLRSRLGSRWGSWCCSTERPDPKDAPTQTEQK